MIYFAIATSLFRLTTSLVWNVETVVAGGTVCTREKAVFEMQVSSYNGASVSIVLSQSHQS